MVTGLQFVRTGIIVQVNNQINPTLPWEKQKQNIDIQTLTQEYLVQFFDQNANVQSIIVSLNGSK